MTQALPTDVDVCIIGAGAAGLAAAHRLAGRPVSAVVLEARDRIGGRAHTIHRPATFPDGETRVLPFDLGCGWLHSADENTLAVIGRDLGLTIDETPPPWRQQAFGLGMTAEEQAAFGRAYAAFDQRVEQAAAGGDDGPASTLFAREPDPDARWNARIDAISGALNGARFAEVSIRDYDAYRDTGVNWRVVEGYGTLVERLGARAPVVSDCAASRIDRSGPMLRVETIRGVVNARAVIVTTPTSILSGERLRFDPPLPATVEAAAGAPLGLASKQQMAVSGAEDFPKDSQLWGRTDTPATAGYHLRPFGRPVIEAYFGGDLAWGLEAEGEAAFFAFAVEELVNLLGSDMRRRLTPIAATMWGADPWSLGAYSHCLPGQADARRRLKAPADARIFIAGEATAEAFYGTCHGAWMEGERAADEALALLGRPVEEHQA